MSAKCQKTKTVDATSASRFRLKPKKKLSSIGGRFTQIDRSSRFIQFVLVVFLVTESPQGVFSIVGGLCIIDYINYYQNLTIFMNVLAFFNTTTSFIIYSTLSSKFRKLFAQLFLPDSIMKRMYQKRSTVMVHTATLN
uniref:G-protein coupled receptors family 1 profile domain-containing protein n=1 Tax=Caenorhabditis japonica TaxID=281687 RepID=A0A8R1I6L6_CAEJA